MKWSDVARQECSAARALSVVGDRWTMVVVREAFLGTRRFDDFQRNVEASKNIVADRLKKLVDHSILERRLYEDRPPRFEYRLTEKGRELYPVLAALLTWGDRWMSGEAGPPVRFIHRGCGKPMDAKTTCGSCGEEIDPRAVRIEAP